MGDPRPLVTIVVATLNSALRLPRCLESVAGQTYPHREVIVKDGGSKDSTLDIIRTHAETVTHWESSRDRGIYDAWNKALPHARGEWIAFLGADDYLWSPTSLEHVARAAAARRLGTRLLSGRVAVVNQQQEVLEVVGRPWQHRGRASLRWLPLPYPALFHHRSVFTEFGVFDDTFLIAGDYDLLVRVLASVAVELVPEVLVAMEVGGISSATVNELRMLREMARVWRKHQLARVPTPAWWWTYAKAGFRVVLRRVIGEPAASQVFDTYRRMKGKPNFWTKR